MNVKLYRFSSRGDDTLGLISVDGVFVCFALEDEHRDVKVPGETRIPAGTYRVELQRAGRLHEKYAERFPDMHRGMLHVVDVPDFEGIMFHCGVDEGDTAGCPLVGDSVTQNVTGNGRLTNSGAAYRRFYPLVRRAIEAGDDVYLDVVDAG